MAKLINDVEVRNHYWHDDRRVLKYKGAEKYINCPEYTTFASIVWMLSLSILSILTVPGLLPDNLQISEKFGLTVFSIIPSVIFGAFFGWIHHLVRHKRFIRNHCNMLKTETDSKQLEDWVKQVRK